ncbi:SipW-dependent-type signal peptide-containing protein [Microbacterium sp. ZW T5_45]|uniref:SipW-dependent-type signal peptide-containing protein n=1 Tax=Microbacterium sp. ZW T5_45 TaxID=3378080 RepID=UPI003852A58B
MATKATRRKALAVLAGGLVLGVGAAVTLAAWNDSEFATGTFQAGAFNLEGSTDGVDYAEHPDAPGAALAFTLPLAGNLSPTDTVYAPFWLRLDDATTTGAEVTVTREASSGANEANISYDIYAIGAAAPCDASASAGTLLVSGDALTDSDAGSTFALAAPVSPAAGVAQKVCVIATAGPETGPGALVEGGAASATWKFAAESD